jgi:hypothetical protein
MRVASENLSEVLRGSFSTRLIVDASYGADRRAMDLPAVAWDLDWDSEAEIPGDGSLTIIYTPEVAESLTPTQFTDILAPFGQELNLRLEVSAGEFWETVQLGHYRIIAVPDARDTHMDHLGETIVVGSSVTVTVRDRLEGVRRSGFHSEQSPPSLDSCWAEIQRLTGMQVLRSVDDKPIPASTVYLAEQGGRLKAVQALAGVLGGVAYVTPDGALSVMPDAPGDVVAELVLGDEGTILDVAHSMESEGVYNEVVGNFESEDREPIFSVAAVTDGPLAVDGPYGRYTRYYSSPFVKTQAAADSAVAAILSQVSSSQTYRVPVKCVLDPRIEDGDVVSVQRPGGRLLIGRVVSHSFGSSPVMDLELDVTRVASWVKPVRPPWVVHPTTGYGLTPYGFGPYGGGNEFSLGYGLDPFGIEHYGTGF